MALLKIEIQPDFALRKIAVLIGDFDCAAGWNECVHQISAEIGFVIVSKEQDMMPGSTPPRRTCLDSDGAYALLHVLKGREKSANDFQSPRLAVHFKHAVIEQSLRVDFSFQRRNTAIVIRVD